MTISTSSSSHFLGFGRLLDLQNSNQLSLIWLETSESYDSIKSSWYYQEGFFDQFEWKKSSYNYQDFKLLGISDQHLNLDACCQFNTTTIYPIQSVYLFKEDLTEPWNSIIHQYTFSSQASANLIHLEMSLEDMTGYSNIEAWQGVVSPRLSYLCVFYKSASNSAYSLAVQFFQPHDYQTQYKSSKDILVTNFDLQTGLLESSAPTLVGFSTTYEERNAFYQWKLNGPRVIVQILDGTKILMIQFNIYPFSSGGRYTAEDRTLIYQDISAFAAGTPLKFYNWKFPNTIHNIYQDALFYSYNSTDLITAEQVVGFSFLPSHIFDPNDDTSMFCYMMDLKCDEGQLINRQDDICLFEFDGDRYIDNDPVINEVSNNRVSQNSYSVDQSIDLDSIPVDTTVINEDTTSPFYLEADNFYLLLQGSICQEVTVYEDDPDVAIPLCLRKTIDNDYFLADDTVTGLAPVSNCRVDATTQVFANVTLAPNILTKSATVTMRQEDNYKEYYLKQSQQLYGYAGIVEVSFYFFNTLQIKYYNLMLLKDCYRVELEPVIDYSLPHVLEVNNNEESALVLFKPFAVTNKNIIVTTDLTLDFRVLLNAGSGQFISNDYIRINREINPIWVYATASKETVGQYLINMKVELNSKYMYYGITNAIMFGSVEEYYEPLLEVRIDWFTAPYFEPPLELSYNLLKDEKLLIDLSNIKDNEGDDAKLDIQFSNRITQKFVKYDENLELGLRELFVYPTQDEHNGRHQVLIILNDDVPIIRSTPNLYSFFIQVGDLFQMEENANITVSDVIISPTDEEFVGQIFDINPQTGQLQVVLAKQLKSRDEIIEKVTETTKAWIIYLADDQSELLEESDIPESEEVPIIVLGFANMNIFTIHLDFSQTLVGQYMNSGSKQDKVDVNIEMDQETQSEKQSEDDESQQEQVRLLQEDLDAEEIQLVQFKFNAIIQLNMTDTSIFVNSKNQTPAEPFWLMTQEVQFTLQKELVEKTQRQIQSIDYIKEFFFGIMGTNLVLNFMISSSLGALWGTINELQYIVYLPLIVTTLPHNVIVICTNLVQLTTFSLFDTAGVHDWLFSFSDELENKAQNESFEFIGIETKSVILNLGLEMFMIFGIVILGFLKLVLIFIGSRFHCLQARVHKMKKSYTFTVIFIRTFLEIYLDTCLAVSIRIQNFYQEEYTSSDIFDQGVAICLAILVIIFPILSFFILRQGYKKEKLKDSSFESKFGEIYMDIDVKSHYSTQFNTFFMIRRFFIMMINFTVINVQAKTQTHLTLCFVVLGFGIMLMPFSDRQMNYMYIFNTTLTILIVSTLFCFTDFIDEKYHEQIGFANIGITLFLLVFNMSLITIQQIIAIVIYCKTNLRKLKYRAKRKYRECKNSHEKKRLELIEMNLQSILVGSEQHTQQKQAKKQEIANQKSMTMNGTMGHLKSILDPDTNNPVYDLTEKKTVSFAIEDQDESHDKPAGRYKHAKNQGEFYPLEEQLVWVHYSNSEESDEDELDNGAHEEASTNQLRLDTIQELDDEDLVSEQVEQIPEEKRKRWFRRPKKQKKEPSFVPDQYWFDLHEKNSGNDKPDYSPWGWPMMNQATTTSNKKVDKSLNDYMKGSTYTQDLFRKSVNQSQKSTTFSWLKSNKSKNQSFEKESSMQLTGRKTTSVSISELGSPGKKKQKNNPALLDGMDSEQILKILNGM